MKKIGFAITLAFGLTIASGAYNDLAAQDKWSGKKKGAVVGGVVGAGTGAIISKKKGKGAIIGGVLGAGTGYVIGRHKDKKAAKKN